MEPVAQIAQILDAVYKTSKWHVEMDFLASVFPE